MIVLRSALFVAFAVATAAAYLEPHASAPGNGAPADRAHAAQAQVDRTPAFSTFSGVVFADDTDAPVRRVRVALAAPGVVADPVFTDDAGRFSLLIPPASSFTVTLSKPGFAPQVLAYRAVPQDALRIRLARGAAIMGRVLDEYNDPVLARVRLVGPDGERTVDTDPLGEFRAGSLAAGNYAIEVASVGEPTADPRGRAAVALAAGQEVSVSLRGAGPRFGNTFTKTDGVRGDRAASDASAAPGTGETGIIRGVVVGATGLPVGGAAVGLGINGAAMRGVVTDANGRFEFTALGAAVYSVGATKFGPSFQSTAQARVPLGQGQILDDVTLVMLRPGTIAGTVRDESGEPVEGVVVELWEPRTGGGRSVLMPVAALAAPARTDDRGHYRLRMAPGRFYVVASALPPGADHAQDATPDSLRTYYPGTTSVGEAVTVEGRTGIDLDGIDILYPSRVAGRLRGFAFDANGRPLTEPVLLMESYRSGAPVPAPRRAPVAADGSFAFANVPPGEYVVHAMVRAAGGAAGELAIAYATVTEGEAAPLVLRTTAGTTLGGRIVLEGETRPAMQQFGLFVQTADWDYLPLGRELPRAVVEEDGSFLMPGLYGPLRITASPPPGWWLKSVDIGAVNAAQQPFVFGGVPRLEDVTVTFADSAGTVTGRVRDRGQPATAYSVLVFSTNRDRWWAPSGYARLARPDADGVFEAFSLAPGDYLAAAVDRFDISTDWLDPDLLAELEPRARRVTVGERSRVNIELDLIRRAP